MSAAIIRLTFRQLTGRRRTLLLAAASLIPVLLAVAFRAADPGDDPVEWVIQVILSGLIVALLLPLSTLVLGTSAFGSEVEDGTMVYLLTKPMARRRIVLSKLIATWPVAGAFPVISAVVATFIAAGGSEGAGRVALAFAIAIVIGSLMYSCLFMMLSLVTSRSFIIGLIYVFVWEGIVTGLFTGTRVLSVRYATLGIADSLSGVDSSVFDAGLGGLPALIVAILVTVGATWLAISRLMRFELSEAG